MAASAASRPRAINTRPRDGLPWFQIALQKNGRAVCRISASKIGAASWHLPSKKSKRPAAPSRPHRLTRRFRLAYSQSYVKASFCEFLASR